MLKYLRWEELKEEYADALDFWEREDCMEQSFWWWLWFDKLAGWWHGMNPVWWNPRYWLYLWKWRK